MKATTIMINKVRKPRTIMKAIANISYGLAESAAVVVEAEIVVVVKIIETINHMVTVVSNDTGTSSMGSL